MSCNRVFLSLLLAGILSTTCGFAQTADFSVSQDTACAPATIHFTSLTTGNPTVIKWSLGDGRNSFESNPAVLYNTPGSYTITLIAYYGNGDTSSFSKTIQISQKPVVSFIADNTLSCKVPFTVNFTDNTSGAASRTWNFGDGSPAITTTANSVSHTYQDFGQRNVTLSVTNKSGCTASLTRTGYINSQQPVLTQSNLTNTSGCIPLSASFSIGTSNILKDPVSNFQWDFGDTSSADNLLTTQQTNVTHTYNQEGIYDIKVLITTKGGCTTTVYYNKGVYAGTPPVANFTYTPPGPVCASQPITFTADTTNSDSWKWTTGDYITTPIPTTSKMTHKFQYTGNLNITLTAYNKRCPSAPLLKQITINPPIANFSFAPQECNKQDAMLFSDKSLGATAWQWDFGDPGSGQNTSAAQNPIHHFSRSGLYAVILKVTNSATHCSDTITKKVYVLNINPVIKASSYSVCKGSPVTFSSTDSSVFSTFTWYFGDGTSPQNGVSVKKSYPVAGIFTDTLIALDINNCRDTIIDPKRVTVEQPTANFTSPSLFCFNQPALFRDQSLPFSPAFPLTKWNWDFGDGTGSDIQNPSKIYGISSGIVNYTAQLTVTDNIGCTDSMTLPLKVNPTPVLIVPLDSFAICRGQSVQLNSFSDNPVTWTPDNNLSCNNCASPMASPFTDIKYIVKASNNLGCTNADTLTLKVSQPFTISTNPKESTICRGSQVSLSVSGGAAKYTWNADPSLSCINCTAPLAMPDSTTTYYVNGYGNDQCFSAMDSTVVNIYPAPEVTAGPDQTVPVGTSIQLKAISTDNITSWQWSPADYLSCTDCQDPISIPEDSITYTVKVTDDKNCTGTGEISIRLICSGGNVFIPNTFTPNGDGVNDIFYPRGKGVKIIRYFRIFNRWGALIFERDNFNINDTSSGWNGSFKGRTLPAGVYVYSSEMVCDNNQVFQLNGNITLLR